MSETLTIQLTREQAADLWDLFARLLSGADGYKFPIATAGKELKLLTEIQKQLKAAA